jgi:cytoskeleton protein RodZ
MKRAPRSDIAAEAVRIGEELRDGRLALGLSLEDVAARLRIRRAYLAALEEGRVRDLPGTAYAVGFVRAYAGALGLDADGMVRRFREGGGALQRKTDLVFPEPVPERGVPAGAMVMAGAVLTIGAYVAWYNWSGSGSRTVDAVPPPPARLEQAAEAPRSPEPAAPLPVPAPGVAPPTAAQAAVPAPVAAMPAPVVPAPVAATAPAPEPQPVAARPEPPPAPAAEAPRIELRARAESWVQIRDPRSGQVVLNRLLRAGETAAVPPRVGLLLTTGKAEHLDNTVDGEPTPALANQVGVRRDIPLDPERLKAGSVAPSGAPGRGASASR